MKTSSIILILGHFVILFLSGCAADLHVVDAEVKTSPSGATVYINDLKVPETTPFKYVFDFTKENRYILFIKKEGYFQKKFIVSERLASLDEGQVRIKLRPSPLWEATSPSPATNNWLQVVVGDNLDTKSAWQLMVDAIVKRSLTFKELNYEAGYLQTKYSVRKFDTANGEFLLRCQLIATLVSFDPFIYRLKDISEWSGNGLNWYPYNRIFKEHASLIEEIQDRLRAN